MCHQSALLGVPTGLVAYYMDDAVPRTAAYALSTGSHVFVYKAMRPHRKFTLPAVPLPDAERTIRCL